jgi:hypothetical protein
MPLFAEKPLGGICFAGVTSYYEYFIAYGESALQREKFRVADKV